MPFCLDALDILGQGGIRTRLIELKAEYSTTELLTPCYKKNSTVFMDRIQVSFIVSIYLRRKTLRKYFFYCILSKIQMRFCLLKESEILAYES